MISLDGLTPGIVDAHLHQWHPSRSSGSLDGMRRRLGTRIRNRTQPFLLSRAVRDYFLTPGAVTRPYEPRQYLADIAAVPSVCGVPVESVVVVETQWRPLGSRVQYSAPSDSDPAAMTKYLAALPFGQGLAPSLGALVVGGDPRSPDFATSLERRLDVSDRIRAVRIQAARHPDPRVLDAIEADGALVSSAALTGLGEAVRHGLALEAFVYSHQLYDVVTLAREFPEATIIVDHFGSPVGAFGPVGARTGATASARADILRLWRERMVTLCAHPNVVVKLSGLALPVLGYGRDVWGNIGSQATLTEMIGPLVEFVVAHFGAERVMVGFNLPIDRPNASADMVAGALLEVLSPWGADMLRNVFRDTARRVYRITD
ncbi:MAG: amidohydrolase family protein [Gordonia sp. (in: high G+C Gram-positive bacteria)]